MGKIQTITTKVCPTSLLEVHRYHLIGEEAFSLHVGITEEIIWRY